MPKMYCICGYMHDLSPIPDEGYIVIKDKDYETLLTAEEMRNRLSKAKEGTVDWDVLVYNDRLVSDLIERLYVCPKCGCLMWKKNDENVHIYTLEDKMSSLYIDYELSEKENTDIVNKEHFVKVIGRLINLWCNRKCLRTLGIILIKWPLQLGLTDDWADLQVALKNIIAFSIEELDNREIEQVHRCINFIDRLIYRKKS